MNEIIATNQNSNSTTNEQNFDVALMTDEILLDVRKEEIPRDKSIILPLAELGTLGAGVASLLPAFNTVTQTATANFSGLYQLANEGIGDTLKIAKNGNFWGAYKTAEGGSKFAQLKAANPVSVTSKTVLKANPATIMMAVALFAVEKEIGNIIDMEKEILSFLQMEKESEIEADVITLTDIMTKYKDNWDNELFVKSNHKLICDIQRTARKNMIFFQKEVEEALKSKHLLIVGGKLNSKLSDMLKRFKYYRLSIYIFSMASMAEMMFSGSFREENINRTVEDIEDNSHKYRELFTKCSEYLEKISSKSVETQVLKGIGNASGAVGKVIGTIPKIKNGQTDELLIENAEKIKGIAESISKDVIESFSKVSNPNTGIFLNKLKELELIYNRTSEICFDSKNIYLIAG